VTWTDTAIVAVTVTESPPEDGVAEPDVISSEAAHNGVQGLARCAGSRNDECSTAPIGIRQLVLHHVRCAGCGATSDVLGSGARIRCHRVEEKSTGSLSSLWHFGMDLRRTLRSARTERGTSRASANPGSSGHRMQWLRIPSRNQRRERDGSRAELAAQRS